MDRVGRRVRVATSHPRCTVRSGAAGDRQVPDPLAVVAHPTVGGVAAAAFLADVDPHTAAVSAVDVQRRVLVEVEGTVGDDPHKVWSAGAPQALLPVAA